MAAVKLPSPRCAQPGGIYAAVPGRMSRCDLGADVWAWTTAKGPFPKRVIAIVAADQGKKATGAKWWILGADGLYRSDDSGRTLEKIAEGDR